MEVLRYDLTKQEIEEIHREVREGGMTLIRNERERQIYDEGYSRTHDGEHTDGSLAAAATAYVLRDPNRWPWSNEIKLGPDRKRELVKAGALYMAESDRLKSIAYQYDSLVLDIAKDIDILRKTEE